MAFNSSTISVGSTTKKSHFDQLLNNTIDLKRENTTINGEKTFASATVFSASATFNSTVRASSIISRTSTASIGLGTAWLGQSSTASVVILKTKMIEIGDWDMDATDFVYVAHGLMSTKIRSYSCLVRQDADTGYYVFPFHETVQNVVAGGIAIRAADPSVFKCWRVGGGSFDSILFDETPYNRGWIIVWYVE